MPLVQVSQQDLAAGGGVERGELPDPVVRRDRRRAAHLVEVDGVVGAHDGEVDGLADLLGQAPADRAALLGEVEAGGHAAGEADDAEAEAVLPAVLGLLDQAPGLQGAEEPEGRRLVDADLRRDLADTGLAALGEDLQHADGPVDRLHAGRGIVAHSWGL